MKKCSAFTLIELLVVVGLMAILVTISVPSLQGLLLRGNMDTEVQEIRDMFADMRNNAVAGKSCGDGSNSQAWGMYFDEDTETITLKCLPTSLELADNSETPTGSSIDEAVFAFTDKDLAAQLLWTYNKPAPISSYSDQEKIAVRVFNDTLTTTVEDDPDDNYDTFGNTFYDYMNATMTNTLIDREVSFCLGASQGTPLESRNDADDCDGDGTLDPVDTEDIHCDCEIKTS